MDDLGALHHLLLFLPVPATTVIHTLSLHDALPILVAVDSIATPSGTNIEMSGGCHVVRTVTRAEVPSAVPAEPSTARSEEHTSELQSREKLVCRPLPEKKKPAAGDLRRSPC